MPAPRRTQCQLSPLRPPQNLSQTHSSAGLTTDGNRQVLTMQLSVQTWSCYHKVQTAAQFQELLSGESKTYHYPFTTTQALKHSSQRRVLTTSKLSDRISENLVGHSAHGYRVQTPLPAMSLNSNTGVLNSSSRYVLHLLVSVHILRSQEIYTVSQKLIHSLKFNQCVSYLLFALMTTMITRHRASTSIYSLTFRICVVATALQPVPRLQIHPTVHN